MVVLKVVEKWRSGEVEIIKHQSLEGLQFIY